MKDKIRKIMFILFVIFLFIFCCCSKANKMNAKGLLPSNAYEITDHGNGWIEFSLDNNRYLYHRYSIGNHDRECITQINHKKSKEGY